MNRFSLAAVGAAAMLASSVLFAYAEPSQEILPEQNSALYYCRTNLNEEEQLLYDALLTCALSEDPCAKGSEFKVSTDPGSEAFTTMFRRSYNALLFDHPELFWLFVGSDSFRYSYRPVLLSENTYAVSLQLKGSFPDRDAQMAALESAADAFLSQIDLTQSAPEVALAIHDKLIDTFSYDKEVADKMGKDLAHTAYGALVANSSGEANCAVCDGYSYAYEYLLQKAGIRSTIITGKAGDDEDTAGPHSWNLVELNGQWYEVDATWDDLAVLETLDIASDYLDIAEEAIGNEWYTDLLTHYLFNRTTAQISFFDPGEAYRYSNDSGWISFLNASVHIRGTADDSASTGDYMTPLAPVAEGTEFSYENLQE